jgi:hypothetical protein
LNIFKGYKNKEYPGDNAVNVWEMLKNNYEPISAPSLLKLDKQVTELPLKIDQDPKTWITNLEDLSV